jgi:hypothetical protein
MSLEDKKLFQLEVEPSMVGIFTSMVLDKIKEIDADIEAQKIALEKIKTSIEEAIDTRNRLQNSYKGLIAGNGSHSSRVRLESNTTTQLEDSSNKVLKLDSNVVLESSTLEENKADGTRFWREKKFLGWRVYVRDTLESSNLFLSLSNFIELTKETDLDERKRLESSISNALSTLQARKKIGTIQVQGFQGRFYGSLSAFKNQWPIETSLNELKARLGFNPELTDVVYPQNSPEDSKANKASNQESKPGRSQMGMEI